MASIDDEGEVHSQLGPSSFHRTLNCAGSNNLIRKLGDKAAKSGLAAAEGSAAHALLERCLTHNEDAWEHLGERISVKNNEGQTNSFEVTGEMIDGVQMAIDWVWLKMREHADKNPILLIERRVASPADKEAFGTCDISILIPGVMLIIADFKYGINIVVEPDEEQLKGYGQYAFDTFVTMGDIYDYTDAKDGKKLAAKETFPDQNTPVELYIIQPRIPHPKGCVRKHDTTKAELLHWFHGEVLPGMAATRDPNAPLTMGDWCNWCPAREFCPAIHASAQTIDINIEPVALNDDELGEMIMTIKRLEKVGARLEEDALRRSMEGKKVKYFKLVRKIANRIWKAGAEEAAKLEWTEAEIYSKPSFLTPPNIEKLAGGKTFASRWSMKPSVGLTLAPDSDKREAVKSEMAAFDEQEGVSDG